MTVKTFCQTVFILYLNIHIRCNSDYRNLTFFFEHFNTRIQDRFISAEFIDDQTFDHLSLVFFKQFHCSIKLCKNAAAVNVSHKKHRGFCHLCHSHIHDIFALQIDFRRTSGSFDHNDIIFFCQLIECLHNIRHQFFLIFKIVSGTHRTKDFPIYNNLGTNIICRFQKDRIHQYRRFNSGSFRLHDLRSSHFKAFTCNKRIQCHILRFKRCHTISVLVKNPAQSGSKKTFSCIGHGSLYHNCFCHSLFPFVSDLSYNCSSSSSASACATAASVVPSRIARISSSFSSCVRTATL